MGTTTNLVETYFVNEDGDTVTIMTRPELTDEEMQANYDYLNAVRAYTVFPLANHLFANKDSDVISEYVDVISTIVSLGCTELASEEMDNLSM